MSEFVDLFFTFARIGALTFGGGYAMLPILQREIVENKKWAEDNELADYYAIGQCTPGIIAVNTATFIGYKHKGVAGGIVATLGLVFPALIIISTIAAFLQNFAQLQVVKDAFAAVRVCVCVLILNAVIKLGKSSVRDALTFGIFLCVLLLSFFTNLSPILWVVLAAAVGILTKGGKRAS
jgi:chromate transporter